MRVGLNGEFTPSEQFLIYNQLEKKYPRSKDQAYRIQKESTGQKVTEINGKKALSGSKGTCIFMDEDKALIKKTITLIVENRTHHLVSYYLKEDIQHESSNTC
ncbi:hypothetical protein HDU67_001066 [Dinochytrium kinnereticum]|nr:hypothetical protein HDU67_001066 [Dinochytrium kinnereticum]